MPRIVPVFRSWRRSSEIVGERDEALLRVPGGASLESLRDEHDGACRTHRSGYAPSDDQSPRAPLRKGWGLCVLVHPVFLQVGDHVGPAKPDRLPNLEIWNAPGAHPFIERATRYFKAV